MEFLTDEEKNALNWEPSVAEQDLLERTWSDDFEFLFEVGTAIYEYIFSHNPHTRQLFPAIHRHGAEWRQSQEFRTQALKFVQNRPCIRFSTPPPQQRSHSARARAAKRPERSDMEGFSVQALSELLLCFFLPPAAVALHRGPSFKPHILLSVVLCVLGWVPGIIHAVWCCFIRGL